MILFQLIVCWLSNWSRCNFSTWKILKMKWRKIKEKEREQNTQITEESWHRTPNAHSVYTFKCTQNIVNVSCQDSCVCSSFFQILFFHYHASDSILLWKSFKFNLKFFECDICFFWSLNYISSNFWRRLYNIFGNEWWVMSSKQKF